MISNSRYEFEQNNYSNVSSSQDRMDSTLMKYYDQNKDFILQDPLPQSQGDLKLHVGGFEGGNSEAYQPSDTMEGKNPDLITDGTEFFFSPNFNNTLNIGGSPDDTPRATNSLTDVNYYQGWRETNSVSNNLGKSRPNALHRMNTVDGNEYHNHFGKKLGISDQKMVSSENKKRNQMWKANKDVLFGVGGIPTGNPKS
jgi:hypothetical protein